METPPSNQSMLPLLARLLNLVLKTKIQRGPLYLQEVELAPQRVDLLFALRGPGPFKGNYRLSLHLEETHPQQTLCTPHWQQGGKLGRLVSLGSKLAPRPLLNQTLSKLWGGCLHVEGERVRIDHARLLDALSQARGKRQKA